MNSSTQNEASSAVKKGSPQVVGESVPDQHFVNRGGLLGLFDQPRVESHYFWFSSRPFFNASLGLCWEKQTSPESEGATLENISEEEVLHRGSADWRTLRLHVYSPQGVLINSAVVELKSSKVSEVGLEPLVEGLAFQNGMRHGMLVVEAPEDVELSCFGRNFSSGFVIQELSRLRGGNTVCMPMTAQDHSQHFLILGNPSEESIGDARIRVLAAGRHKDIVCEISPRSVSIIGIESTFAALLQKAKTTNNPAPGQGNQAYIRVSARGDAWLGIQLFEQQNRDERKPQYTFISM